MPGSLWNLRDVSSNPSCSGPMRSREKTAEHMKRKELGESMNAKAIHWKEWRMETERDFECELTNSGTLQPSTLATCTLTPPGGQKGKHFNSILFIWAKSQQHKGSVKELLSAVISLKRKSLCRNHFVYACKYQNKHMSSNAGWFDFTFVTGKLLSGKVQTSSIPACSRVWLAKMKFKRLTSEIQKHLS